MFTDNEKKMVKVILQKEFEVVENEGKTIIHPDLDFFKGEEEYKAALQELIKKL